VIFGKVYEFVENSDFGARSACFVIFALGVPLFSFFGKIHEFLKNRSFQPEINTFSSFSHWAYHFLAILSRVYEFLQIRVFSPRAERFVIFELGAKRFSDF